MTLVALLEALSNFDVDLSSGFLKLLPEPNWRPRLTDKALTNCASFALSRMIKVYSESTPKRAKKKESKFQERSSPLRPNGGLWLDDF